MARLKKTNGYYRKRFRIEKGGKVYSVYAKTLEELRENENKKRLELEKGLQQLKNPTLSQYIKHHLQECEKITKTATIYAKTHAFNLISSVKISDSLTLGEIKLKDITRRTITDAREILLQSGKTPEYLNVCFVHLNGLFNNAVREEVINRNPMEKLQKLKRQNEKINETLHRSLTQEEIKLFFEYAKKRNSAYTNCFLFMIKTGTRAGEATALMITDIDLKTNKIHINKTITKDLNGTYIVGNDTKTEKSKRDIPLTSELLEIINAQEQQNKFLFGVTDINDSRIFKSVRGKILTASTLNKEIKAICEDAGIDTFTCHCFRNTFCTEFINQRPGDYKILADLVGHSNVSLTLNLYTHTTESQKENSMNSVYIKTS